MKKTPDESTAAPKAHNATISAELNTVCAPNLTSRTKLIQTPFFGFFLLYVTHQLSSVHEWSGVWNGLNTTIDALLFETKLLQNPTGRKKMSCIYCSGQHWSDERQKFSTVTARKEKV